MLGMFMVNLVTYKISGGYSRNLPFHGKVKVRPYMSQHGLLTIGMMHLTVQLAVQLPCMKI